MAKDWSSVLLHMSTMDIIKTFNQLPSDLQLRLEPAFANARLTSWRATSGDDVAVLHDAPPNLVDGPAPLKTVTALEEPPEKPPPRAATKASPAPLTKIAQRMGNTSSRRHTIVNSPNCSGSQARAPPCLHCEVLPPLLGLATYLSDGRGKSKFLEATEIAIKHDESMCVPGTRLLDVGAGGGEFTRWLAERCGMCTKAYDVEVDAGNQYKLLQTDGAALPVANRFSDKVGKSDASDLARRHRESFHVHRFDGVRVPEASRSFELVVLNSVLHHAAANAPALLLEAARVTTRHVLVFEDLAIPDDPRIMARHRLHDPNGTFRTSAEWEERFGDADLRVELNGPVGSVQTSQLKFQKHARLDWRHQRFFLLSLGARRRVPDNETAINVSSASGRYRKRRCIRLETRFGVQQCHDVAITSRANWFWVYV